MNIQKGKKNVVFIRARRGLEEAALRCIACRPLSCPEEVSGMSPGASAKSEERARQWPLSIPLWVLAHRVRGRGAETRDEKRGELVYSGGRF